MKSNGNQQPVITPRLMDVPQAAIYCCVSPSRIRQYIRYRKLHPVRLPHPWKESKNQRKTLLDIKELDSLIEQGIVEGK
jgi:hypothetical protein